MMIYTLDNFNRTISVHHIIDEDDKCPFKGPQEAFVKGPSLEQVPTCQEGGKGIISGSERAG